MNNVLFVCHFLYLLPVLLSYLILYLSCMIHSTIDSQLIYAIEENITPRFLSSVSCLIIISYSRPVGRGGAGGCTCTPLFQPNNCMSFTEVLNCMSNRLRLHAILSISLTKPHLVRLINITTQSISSYDQYMHIIIIVTSVTVM